MPRPPLPLDLNAAIAELRTVRDFIRYAVSRFNAANLTYGHGTDNAFDEAVFLALEGLQLPVDHLEPYLDARLTEIERRGLAGLIEARIESRLPASYLLNKAYLHGLSFYVDERVIVPRSFIGDLLTSDLVGGEGFTLVDDPARIETVLDLCTGSGCLAILAAHLFPNARVDAVDLSAEALEVALKNVTDYGLNDRVTLFRGDLFAPVAGRAYDLIITNPPYVEAAAMDDLPAEYRAEPAMALAGGGSDGMEIVRRILDGAPAFLNPGAGLLCEVGTGRPALENDAVAPHLLWLDTDNSHGEVFWITREELQAA